MNRTILFLLFSVALHMPLAALVVRHPTLPPTVPLLIKFEEEEITRDQKPKPEKLKPRVQRKEEVKPAPPRVETSPPDRPPPPVEEPRLPDFPQGAVPVPSTAADKPPQTSRGITDEKGPSLLPPSEPLQERVESPPPPPRDLDALRKDYFREVMRRIDEKKEYPPVAIRRNWQGKIGVAFTIGPDGSIDGVRIVRKSDYPLLDEAALDAVKRAAPFPAPPEELKPPLNLRLDIVFTLND